MEIILTDRAARGIHLTSKEEGVKNQKMLSNKENLARALDVAKQAGIKKILCVPEKNFLKLLAENESRWPFEIMGHVPNFPRFVRDTSHYGTTGAAVRRVWPMSLSKKIRLIILALKHVPKVLSVKFEIAMNLFLMAEAAGFKKPKALILHSQITDFALAFGQEKFFRIFYDIARNELGAEPGLSTINFSTLIETLQRNNLSYPWLISPFNPKGYQMNKSPDDCIRALKSTSSKVIADHWYLGDAGYYKEGRAYLSQHPFAAATIELPDLLNPSLKI